MFDKSAISTAVVFICTISSHAIAQEAGSRDSFSFEALNELKNSPGFLTPQKEVTFEELVQHGVRSSGGFTEWAETVDNRIPTFVPGTVILEIDPNATTEEIKSYFEKNSINPTEIYANIGQKEAEYDISKYLKDDADPLTPPLTEEEKIINIINGVKDLERKGIVTNVTPDSFLSKFDDIYGVLNIEKPEIIRNRDIGNSGTQHSATEEEDWGIIDIEAHEAWQKQTWNSGIIVGVLDTGFVAHEDLTFLAGNMSDIPASDHGTHVAGIMCAKHNGRGTKGVLKNCFVAQRTGSFEPIDENIDPSLSFYTSFSQISATLNDFVPDVEGPRVFNISLGYNWRANFGINPDDQESSAYRALVQNQGEMLIRVYSIAERRNKAIFSAAGNDSHGLGEPRSAKNASPFNWAAIEARARGRSKNGAVVEAHDNRGHRASFSNIGGLISCPGVNILSTIAKDENGIVHNNIYGRMSGTSMASPYCAGGYGLLFTLFPNKSPSEIIECMLSTNYFKEAGTPRLKLTTAMEKCED